MLMIVSAYIDSNKVGLELLTAAEALTLELRLTRRLNCSNIRYWSSAHHRYIQEHYTEIDAIDPAKEIYDCFPFAPLESFITKPYVPFYYKKQAYATPDALYLVTRSDESTNRPQTISYYPFIIHKIDPASLGIYIRLNPDEYPEQTWHRIADPDHSIASVSLVPGIFESDEPLILIFFKTGAALIHSKKERWCKPFTLPDYCTDTHHICLADDPQSGKRVMYDSDKYTFWLVEQGTGFSLPIQRALYAFFFDKGKSLYVQQSRSVAFCVDLANNTKYPLEHTLACDEISSDHVVQLHKSTMSEKDYVKRCYIINLEHHFRGRASISQLMSAACNIPKLQKSDIMLNAKDAHSQKILTSPRTESCALL